MIEQLIARLEAATTDYKTVRNAWTLDGAMDDIHEAIPMALFIPGEMKSEWSPQMPIRQRATESVGVITVCKWQELAGLRKRLWESLIGYQHTEHHDELQHHAGRVKAIHGEIVEYTDTFVTHHWITGNRARIVATETDIPIASEDGDTIAAP